MVPEKPLPSRLAKTLIMARPFVTISRKPLPWRLPKALESKQTSTQRPLKPPRLKQAKTTTVAPRKVHKRSRRQLKISAHPGKERSKARRMQGKKDQ